MKEAILSKGRLEEFLGAMGNTAAVYAPVESGQNIVFGAVSGPGAASDGVRSLRLGASNTRLSVKGLFFPQREPLFSFRDDAVKAVAEPKAPLVAFGVRPCDAMALTFLDKVFGPARVGSLKHEDPYYLARRGAGTVISLGCNKPCSTCFCTSVGGHPFGIAGTDVLATELPDGSLLLEAVTEKGQALLDRHAGLFSAPSSAQLDDKGRISRAAEAAVRPVHAADAKARADAAFDSAVWEALTSSCLGCGACTFVCPTCHCFDISDETGGNGEGVRLRSWDSCQYPLFTAHASGHNPRPARRQRMRQRVMHKFSYTPETAGMVSCMGCGRCVAVCPVNLDIREIVAALGAKP